MKQIVVFGTGDISYALSYYVQSWGEYEISGYAVDADYLGDGLFLDKPVVTTNEMVTKYPPEQYGAFVAIGYQDNNSLRREKVAEVEASGYRLVNIVNPQAPTDLIVGKNCFVASGELIQPGVTLHNDVFIWSGALIGHHSELLSHSWVSGGAAIGGNASIGECTFVGIGATIGHRASTGKSCIIGAGAIMTKAVDDGAVLIARDTEVYRMNSEQFLRFSSRFSN